MIYHSIKSFIDRVMTLTLSINRLISVRYLVLIASLFLLLSSYLYAIPMTSTLEVTLSDSDSGLLNGRRSVLVEVYDNDKNNMIWSTTYPNQLFTNGVSSILLGPFNELDLDIDSPKVSLTINSDEVVIPIISSLYSLHANIASKAKQLYDTDALYLYTAPNGDKRVGIGTQTPSEKLEINGNIKFTNSGTGILFSDGSILSSATQISQWINNYIYPGPNNSLIISANSNLGLGVTQALAKLHVSGNVRLNGIPSSLTESTVLTLDSNGNVYTRDLDAGILRGFEDNPLAIGLPQSTAEASLHIKSLDNTSDIIKLLTSSDHTALVLDSAGKLGIGVDNPNASLHILSSSTTDPLLLAKNASNLGVKLDHNGKLRLGKLDGTQEAVFELIPTSNSDDIFAVKDNNGADQMRIQNDGSIVFSGDLHINTLNASTVFISNLADDGSEETIVVIDSSGQLKKRDLPNTVWTNDQIWEPGSGFIYYNGSVSIATDNMDASAKLFVDGEIYASGGYRFSDDSIQHSGLAIDPNTRFVSVGTNNATNTESLLRLYSTNNAQAVFKALGTTNHGLLISSSGNIGIGDLSPTALLSIQPPAGNSLPILKVASTTQALLIASTGNIGIGTENALSAKLTLVSTASAQDLLDVNDSSGNSLFHVSSTGNIGIKNNDPQAALHINHTDTNNAIQLNSNGFSVNHLGYIGVGTVSPTASLHIVYPPGSNDVLKIMQSGSPARNVSAFDDTTKAVVPPVPIALKIASFKVVFSTVNFALALSVPIETGIVLKLVFN